MNTIFIFIFALVGIVMGGLKLRIDYNSSWRTVIIFIVIFTLAWILVVIFVL
jgi:hypothetical protein